MEGICEPTLGTRVLLAFMEDVSMDKDEIAGFDGKDFQIILRICVLSLLLLFLLFHSPRQPRPFVLDERRAAAVLITDETTTNAPTLAPVVRPSPHTQGGVSGRSILQRNPPPHRRRRVGIQELGVPMRRDCAADARLLADDHALQAAGLAEAERGRDGRVAG